MQNAVIPISRELVEVLGHVPTMQRWEILRRAPRPYTVAQLAEESRASCEAVQRSLDRLMDVNLVVRTKATKRMPRVTYASAMRRLVVTWSKDSPEDRACRQAHVDSKRSWSKSTLDACSSYLDGPTGMQICIGGATSVQLLDEDAAAVTKGLHLVYATLAAAEQRARTAPSGLAKPYHLAFEFHETAVADLPMAELFITERESVSRCCEMVMGAASLVLSPRELEIARALVAGKLRPQIAADLGLAANTVATVSKRIYRKLGVSSRPALVARLHGA
ncbi:MAG: Bacterial regulatory protein luxR family [Planctomycetota bacterium]|jgi:DNA-binding CsgD family transcriptional regulator